MLLKELILWCNVGREGFTDEPIRHYGCLSNVIMGLRETMSRRNMKLNILSYD